MLAVGFLASGDEPGQRDGLATAGGLYFLGYTIVTFVPRLAIGARRLHDTGRRAWWLLLLFASFIGWIIFIVFVADGSKDLNNPYGPAPADSESPNARSRSTARPAPSSPTEGDTESTQTDDRVAQPVQKPPDASSGSQDETADALRRIKALHDEGILTDDEYETKRKALSEQI